MDHLAIMDRKTITMIIDGKKKIESRFSKHKIAPFHMINKGDKVYLKISGGKITAIFTAGEVTYFENLNPNKIEDIKEKYNDKINAPDNFWNAKCASNYGTLIKIDNPKAITPFRVKKAGRQAFISYKDSLTDHIIK